MAIEHEKIVLNTRRWVQSVVIGLNLCPFARKVFNEERIRYVVSDAKKSTDLLKQLSEEADLLANASRDEIETTLLIHPKVFEDFLDYNDFLDPAEGLLQEAGYEGVLQIASFHPRYQFGGTKPDDVENYTNRSPYPMLHLLREESIDEIADEEKALELIPERNIETLRKLGLNMMRQKLREATGE